MSDFAQGALWVCVIYTLTCGLIWSLVRRRIRLTRDDWEVERRELIKLQVKPKNPEKSVSKEVVPPEKRVLWRPGDRTEVDIGNGIYTLATILDFDEDDDDEDDEGGELSIVRLRFENSPKGKGFWWMPVDDLRKPREGLPEVLPAVEDPSDKEK